MENHSNPVQVPYLFTLCKRYLRQNKIKYTFFHPAYTIITRPVNHFPSLILSFSPGRVRVAPVPLNGWSIDVKAQTFDEVLQKIENHKLILRK